MSVSVHKDSPHLDNYVDGDLVQVGTRFNGTRLEYANPETTCLHRMRGWKGFSRYDYDSETKAYGPVPGTEFEQFGYCMLDKDHRGRHSTSVFYCDACGKARRGERPYRSEHDINGDPVADFCFMCCEVTR